jgi:type II secretory ATPase GspE/PulE/Tfp pilus assembly ATPase PilB-like protein
MPNSVFFGIFGMVRQLHRVAGTALESQAKTPVAVMNLTDLGLSLSVHQLPAEEAIARLLDHALENQASDLLLGANDNHVVVSMRHLGIHRCVTLMPLDQGKACIGHIKAMSGLDFAEHRRPLDGRWLRQTKETRIELRVSVLPTLSGEDVNLRFLNRPSQFLGLDRLGLPEATHRQLLDIVSSPSGLVLVTGPTASGKTTTQYAILQHLNDGQRKINTIEDPIEHDLPGVRQSQVNHHLDLGFPEMLRAVLRQAPDVIMLGEIRDTATADTAIRAAGSGHLVLATLHAPGAASAIFSLQALGVSPHFLGMSLRAVLGQRLVRTLCPVCRTATDEPVAGMFAEIEPLRASACPPQAYSAQGCPECRSTGYSARTAIFELMPICDELRHFIYERRSPGEMYRHALHQGMLSFRSNAWLRVANGETTMEEVRRVLPPEFLNA